MFRVGFGFFMKETSLNYSNCLRLCHLKALHNYIRNINMGIPVFLCLSHRYVFALFVVITQLCTLVYGL